jgi:hypothetical protein
MVQTVEIPAQIPGALKRTRFITPTVRKKFKINANIISVSDRMATVRRLASERNRKTRGQIKPRTTGLPLEWGFTTISPPRDVRKMQRVAKPAR